MNKPTLAGMGGPPQGTGYDQYLTDASAKESYRIKDGVGGKDIFIDEAVRDVPKYQPTLGKKLMDVIMYPAGANHPMVVTGRIKQGTMVHITWTFVHKRIGPSQDWIICLAKTYGQRCPICEYSNMIRANSNLTDEEVRAATAPYYAGKYPLGIYNCIHHTNPNQITWSEPVMYWPINNSFMESKLQAQAKQTMITEEVPTGYINYQWPTAGPQGGRHIEYEIITKGQFFDYIGHKFYIRQGPVPPHVLQAVHCLDDFLLVPTFDEVREALEADIEMKSEAHVGGEQPTGEVLYPGPEIKSPIFGTPEPQCQFFEYGGRLGETFDNYQECQSCQVRGLCQAKATLPPAEPPTPGPAAEAPRPAPRSSPPIPRRPVR